MKTETEKQQALLNSIIELNNLGKVDVLKEIPRAPLLAKRVVPPTHIGKRELPVHRAALELSAQGFTNKEISERLGYTESSISIWLRQPHAQQILVDEIRAAQSEDEQVMEIIKANVVNAITTVVEVMNDECTKRADRLAAAEKILERRYGKANQPINRATDVDLNNLSDAELVKMLPPTERTANNE